MISLPEKFLEDVKVILQDEYEEFIDSYNENKTTGLRLNTMKMSKEKFQKLNLFDLEQIPWTNEGFYYDESVCKPGKNPLHEAGVYYLQEPSAMSVVPKLDIQKGDRVLDMCAAPGGKSTYILSQLDDTGLLVSNEINPIRINALGENLERFGARNCIITNTDSTRLRKAFTGYFDKIVIDAPCSGEGMFRKDPAAIQYWHEAYPVECAELQKKILAEAMKMLAAGGNLVYSTCTWAPEENEAVIRWLLSQYDYLELVNVPKLNGMVQGIDMPQVARMYPHLFKGEGQFIAKLRDRRSSRTVPVKSARNRLKREQEQLWQDFAHKHLNVKLDGFYQTFGDKLYLLPHGLPDMSQLKIARNGLHLGTFKKNRFEPSYALAKALCSDSMLSYETTEEEAARYLHGETLMTSTSLQGWVLVCYQGFPLGFAKATKGILKNHYPKGLRTQY